MLAPTFCLLGLFPTCTQDPVPGAAPAAPQAGETSPEPPQSGETSPDPSQADPRQRFLDSIEAREGPLTGELGSQAEIDVPAGFIFAGASGTKRFLEMNQNPTAGNETGLLMPWTEADAGDWFVCFSFGDVGYVKDDEKDELDADALLEALRRGQEVGNQERKKRGWAELELVGWERPPFYDPATHNLTWATRLRSEGRETVNWSTRLLGRRGTMDVELVIGPDELERALPRFQQLIDGFRYKSGERYAEYHAGDKVAKYGLGALVLGGAGAVAAKTGLLAKFWKLLVVGGVAVAGFVKRMWSRVVGRRHDQRTEIPPSSG